jgi:Tfp pilus assembly protein PilN
LVVGGGLCAYWVWSLRQASENMRQTLSQHTQELGNLQAAIEGAKAGSGAAAGGLVQQLQARQADVLKREKLLVELRRGMFREGFGQSARLQLVAQSIPSQVWVTGVRADERQLEVSGYTLEPAALNEWVSRLAASPLLQGQRLATVKIERYDANASAGSAAVAAAAAVSTGVPVAAAAGASQAKPMWSFSLLSSLAVPTVVTAIAGATP